ncbi:ABC transporter permease [Clostridium ihumii]|uniref:ABC transporter permease n=1 Tax=Clostridium ihumii TaxID=1470356 RepID=UPI003D340A5B
MFKKYLRILKIEFTRVREYFLNFIGQVVYLPVQFLLVYFLWKYIYSSNTVVAGYSFYEMISYYYILMILQSAIMPVGVTTYEEWNHINKGDLNMYLSRPISYPIYMFFTKIGYFIWNILFGLILIFIIIFILASKIEMNLTLSNVLLFCVSTVISFIIMFNLFFLVGTLTFWVENVLTLRDNLWNIIKIFSGQIFPIAMFPQVIRRFCSILPFQYIYYIPIAIFQGKLLEKSLLYNFIGQIVWALLLTLINICIWKNGIKNYASQGG